MKKNILLFIFLIYCMLTYSQHAYKPEITSKDVKYNIDRLASDEWAGRKPGTPGGDSAAYFIRNYFKSQGLELLFKDGLQEFELVTSAKAGVNNYIKSGNVIINSVADVTPFSFSSKAIIKAPIVFAGYGFDINQDSLLWNDFNNVDVKGKWVLILRGYPKNEKYRSALSSAGDERTKVLAAKDRGAKGVIFINGMSYDKDDKPIKVFYDKSNIDAGLPVLWLSRKALSLLDERVLQRILEDEATMNNQLKSSSYDLGLVVEGAAEVLLEKVKTYNVAAILRGNDPVLKDEYIVVGAHYDHLGMGGYGSGSRMPDTIAPHNGADDNASGVSAVMELAGYFVHQQGRLARSVIFVAFGAEESGLIGSNWFVSNPPVPNDKVKMMLNFDMVGRMNTKTRSFSIGGTGTSKEGETILNELLSTSTLKANFSKEGYGPSDHASFYGVHIPVLYFNSGVHTDYHTPFDRSDKINAEGEVDIVVFVSYLMQRLASNLPAWTYQEAGPAKQQRMGRLKVTFGIMPDFTSTDSQGLGVSGVTPGGPADRAGIKKDDRILAIDGKTVTDIYDYMNRLKKLQKGNRVSVDLDRKGERVVVIVEL